MSSEPSDQHGLTDLQGRQLRQSHQNRPWNPVAIWRWSIRAHRANWFNIARCLKALNFLVFRCVLPPEVRLGEGVTLGHYGFGVVIHPNTEIGDFVHLWHGVTVAAEDAPGGRGRVVIGAGTRVGAGAVIARSRSEEVLLVGENSRIGPNVVLTHSVPAGTRVYTAAAQER